MRKQEPTSWTFDNDGRTSGQTFNNGQIDVYGYDSRSRMTSLTHENSSLTTISAETYTWDNVGNLTAKSIDTNSWSYGYDNDDQLTSETAPSYSASYTYDANGNRASYTTGGVTQTYNVDHGDKLTSITSGGTTIKSYGYDAAGRTASVTSSAGTTTLSYDYEDRVTGITYPSSATNSFTYNALDTRVGKTDSTGTYTYVRDGAGVTSPVLGDGAATYTPGVSQHRGSVTTFDNNDYLGTANRQTDSTQSTTATRSYDAFGNLVGTTGSPVGPFGFVGGQGYQEDGDSGLKLLGHRYYDPSTGRFLTRDTTKDGRNWYVYCGSNPLTDADPNGDESVPYVRLPADDVALNITEPWWKDNDWYYYYFGISTGDDNGNHIQIGGFSAYMWCWGGNAETYGGTIHIRPNAFTGEYNPPKLLGYINNRGWQDHEGFHLYQERCMGTLVYKNEMVLEYLHEYSFAGHFNHNDVPLEKDANTYAAITQKLRFDKGPRGIGWPGQDQGR